MDFEFDEQQQFLQRSFREFFERECPESLVRQVENEEGDYSRELWRLMAELGMLGTPIPEKYGGADGTFLDLAILCDEAGRVLAPVPLVSTVAVCGMAILDSGTDKQRADYLPKIASGDQIMTLAYTERSFIDEAPEGVKLQAKRNGDGWTLDGEKVFVRHAPIADTFLVVARTSPARSSTDGLTLFLVDADDPNVTVRPYKVTGGERMGEVKFANLSVAAGSVLGDVDGGWVTLRKIVDRGRAVTACWMAGATDNLEAKTVEYMKERITFGRPIGANQALQHRMSQIQILAYGGRFQAYRAAWAISNGLDDSAMVAIAKLAAAEAYRLASNEGIQLHGGYGFSKEFYVQLYWRRQKLDEMYLGDIFQQKELVTNLWNLSASSVKT